MGIHPCFAPLAIMRDPDSPLTCSGYASRRVLLANPRGFCAGVTRAIDSVEQALAVFGRPVYVRRPIVHNHAVLARLEDMGAIFVREVEDVPEHANLILSAHGVDPSVVRAARARRLNVIDATCPLVTKVHVDVVAHHRAGRHVLLIGHVGHPEIVGTIGHVPTSAISLVSSAEDVEQLDIPSHASIAYAVQTTFSVKDARAIVAAIRDRFTDVAGPRSGNICYATTNRQTAVEAMAAEADYMLVVGDDLSSNAQRLIEVALAAGCPEAALVNETAAVDWTRISQVQTVGLTAAASTPASSIEDICHALAEAGFAIIEQEGLHETVRFKPVAIDPT